MLESGVREMGVQGRVSHSVHLGGLLGRELSLACSTTGANRELWRVNSLGVTVKTPTLNEGLTKII